MADNTVNALTGAGAAMQAIPGVGTIAGTALMLGAQAYGMFKSAEENRKRQALLNQQQKFNTDWFNKEYNTNLLDTSEAKSGLRTVMDHINKRNEVNTNTAAITGASDESQIANNQANNETYAGFVNNLASRGQERKDNISNMYIQRKNALDQGQQQIGADNQASWQNYMTGASAIGKSFGIADMIGAKKNNKTMGSANTGTGALNTIAINDKINNDNSTDGILNNQTGYNELTNSNKIG